MNTSSQIWVLIFALIIFFAREAHGESSCPANFQALGCYTDSPKRALPDPLQNKRQKRQRDLLDDLWTNYRNILPSLICDCAKEAQDKGYRVFAIQYFGECWAGKTLASLASQRYKPKRCVDVEFNQCSEEGPDRKCAGKKWSNFVYILQEQSAAQPTTGQPQGIPAQVIKEDACTSSPCENRGTCIVTGDDSYTCECAEGFYEDNCEKINACASSPCKNGGLCEVTGDNSYMCQCTSGFYGDTCDKVNRCISSPCQNGGSCTITGNNTYRCQCAEGFYGFDCEKDCSKPLDIALAIDASGSVGLKSFQLVKSFLKKFSHHFEVNHTVHFSCLHYDHKVYNDFLFKDSQYHNHASLDAKLQSMTYPSGATLTDRALWEVRKFFMRSNGARDDGKVHRVLVLLTDGRTYGGKARLIPPAYELKERVHVRIVPIGVGFQVSEEELDVMSSGGHYVLVDRFEDLANALYDVMDLVCTW